MFVLQFFSHFLCLFSLGYFFNIKFVLEIHHFNHHLCAPALTHSFIMVRENCFNPRGCVEGIEEMGNGFDLCFLSVLFKILYSNVLVIIIEFVVVKCSALCVEFR